MSSVKAPEGHMEAMESGNRNEWCKAMQKELDCLNVADTWELVDLPEGKRVLEVKWVFTTKAGGG